MNWDALAAMDKFSSILVATKLMVMALVTLVACVAFGIPGPIASTLVLFAALPTASAAHVLAAGFGADRTLAATLVAQSTLLGAVTLPIWITIIEVLL